MPKWTRAEGGSDFAPPPAGTHLGVCYRFVDLGTQEGEWQGKKTHYRKVLVSWELPDERMDDGRPLTFHQRYTWSTSEKARIRQDLEAWRGKAFSDEDFFGPRPFSFKSILGKACLLSLVHNTSGGKTYANLRGIAKLPKNSTAPAPSNELVYFDLDEYDVNVFDKLSEGLRATIMRSPEWQELHAGETSDPVGDPRDDDPPPPAYRAVPLDDDIPF